MMGRGQEKRALVAAEARETTYCACMPQALSELKVFVSLVL